MKYKLLKHTGDIKFQAEGKTLRKAFLNSALILKEIMTEEAKIKAKKKKKIKIKGKDEKQLLLNFLEEFLFLLDAEDFILSKIKKLKIKDNKLEAEIVGDKASSYGFSNSVKAITYSEMKIEKKRGKFIIQIVLDV